MQYMLLVHSNENSFAQMTPEQQQKGYGAYMAYMDALQQAKVHVASGRLRPTSSTSSVRIVDGKTQVLDGPFIDTKEQLGGYFLIEVPDLDAAIHWAARCPGASHGTVEVRPIWVM